MLTKTAWAKMWQSYMCDLNVKYGYENSESKFHPNLQMRIRAFSPHQLRHTYATILYTSGVDILTAQKQLGHSDVKTTIGIYTHLEAEREKNSIDKLNSYISKQYASDMQVKTSNK